jgi:hypothetical protein
VDSACFTLDIAQRHIIRCSHDLLLLLHLPLLLLLLLGTDKVSTSERLHLLDTDICMEQGDSAPEVQLNGARRFCTGSATPWSWPILRRRQQCSDSRISQHFMQPRASLPCSQELSSPFSPAHTTPSELSSPFSPAHTTPSELSNIRF